MMEQARQVTYLGDRVGLRLLVHELEQHGVQVRWDAPEERRNQAGGSAEDYVELDVVGSAEAIRTAVERVCDEDPDADIRIEDDGGD